jgi:diguanylate cyclase (GGDEF)-like protein
MEMRNIKPARGMGGMRETEARAVSSARAAAAQGASDVLSLAGIAEAELTPKLRQAILMLLGDADTLRCELRDARSRIAHLERLVDQDALMPVANRRAFMRELTRMMAFTQRYRTRASIVYFDVDGMKQINDANGHAAGDAVLVQVARVLVDNVRSTDVVGRLGGDELGVLLVQTDRELAERKAADLAVAIATHPLHWQGHALPVTVSYGVHAFSGGENADAALEAADRAMYAHKRRQKPAE